MALAIAFRRPAVPVALVCAVAIALRAICYGLRPPMLDDLGLSAALGRLVSEVAARSDVEISICPYFRGTDADGIKRYAELGVDRVIVVVFGFDREGLVRAADEAAALVEVASAL